MKYYFLLIAILVLSSCNTIENEGDFKEELTIEGYIEYGKHAYVYLTVSLPFLGEVDSLEIMKAMETKAKVELISENFSEILTLKRDDSRYPFLYYRSNLIKGNVDENYEIKVSLGGEEFTANTQVPEEPVITSMEAIDSKDEKRIKLSIENNYLKNCYYRVLIKDETESKFSHAEPYIVNNENVKTEQLINVIKYMKRIDGEKENQLAEGGVYDVKLVAITQDEYLFIKSVKGDKETDASIPSFSEEIYTNLSGGAFGFWAGEHSTQKRIVIE